jgi:hypothetical protein
MTASPTPPRSTTGYQLIHPITGHPLRPLLSTRQTAEILGWSEATVMARCASGDLATMPRNGTAPWQIITAKLLRQLGLVPEVNAPDPTADEWTP